MSLFDNLMQSLSDTAQSAVEHGQYVGAVASLQIALKKLQIERAKQMYDLGQRSYEWHKAGTLTVAGKVPDDLVALCLQIDDVNRDIDATHRQIEAERQRLEVAKLQAEVDRMKTGEARHESSVTETATPKAPPGNYTDAPLVMKLVRHRLLLLLALLALPALVRPASAAPLGRATAAFDDSHPEIGETEWGRLVADAIRSATQADIALIDAGAFKRGTLKAGPIEAADIDGLLSFGDDDVVTLTISGAQLRAALERAVQAYPTGSPAFLHGSGFVATFNSQAPINQRLTMVRVQGREVDSQDNLRVAMPISLAEGAAGYFTIWNGKSAQRSGATLSSAIADFVHERGSVSPDAEPRLAPQ